MSLLSFSGALEMTDVHKIVFLQCPMLKNKETIGTLYQWSVKCRWKEGKERQKWRDQHTKAVQHTVITGTLWFTNQWIKLLETKQNKNKLTSSSRTDLIQELDIGPFPDLEDLVPKLLIGLINVTLSFNGKGCSYKGKQGGIEINGTIRIQRHVHRDEALHRANKWKGNRKSGELIRAVPGSLTWSRGREHGI